VLTVSYLFYTKNSRIEASDKLSFRTNILRVSRTARSVLQYRVLRHPRPRPFIILTTSRSGSTWLSALLTQALYIDHIRENFRPQHFQDFQTGDIDSNVLLKLAQSSFGASEWLPQLGSKLIWDSMPALEQNLSS
jgi:hypothetical protein